MVEKEEFLRLEIMCYKVNFSLTGNTPIASLRILEVKQRVLVDMLKDKKK